MFKLVSLGMRRLVSAGRYREMQRYIAESTVIELKKRGIVFSESRVLELGSGSGGYSAILNLESKSFLASDISKNDFYDQHAIPFRIVDVQKPFPFETGCFDFIYCSSLIEHVADPGYMLSEARRVLRPGGFLYLSFPPFYSLAMVGGHQFKPFHLLSERIALKAYNLWHGTAITSYATCYEFFGLSRLTIKRVKGMILASDYKISDIYTRMCPLNTACLPGILADLLTWHACCLAQKP